MMLSAFDIFKVGIGPSSSHTVGPMRAARLFALALDAQGLLPRTARVQAELLGSLGATGRGHATDQGVLLGLLGESPDTVDPAQAALQLAAVRRDQRLCLLGTHAIAFDAERDIAFLGERSRPEHPNAMHLAAHDAEGRLLHEAHYFSVGGGFVVEGSARASTDDLQVAQPPWPFRSGDELIALAQSQGLSIAQLMLANECAWRPEPEVRAGLLRIWQVMQACVQRGLGQDNAEAVQPLPGALRLRRRAPALARRLMQDNADPLAAMDWVNAYAMAVNEENAAGGRVVTAPTNGAAGIVPAVLHYYWRFVPGADEAGVVDFLLTAAAIGVLYKTNASISGAEVGCQGEVGVACSMAAGALAAVQGGTPLQVENAAEIGMEHNLGLTCDPVGGLVQIPCVERNAMGAIKAINAARMALRGDGTHSVSLDTVIRTMKQTGEDMKATYKETSLGGLAVNVVAC
ncbi:L-serine ammonia-lyase [Comamonas serinivorans]|uniref:L-serine dehydratase n=1 Tax=Comamonas serinivorans TaxID=1082851 RepID=A0A1Y0EK60_9BURK|nr:L-serine ammonia-lyase [Comamonas serinivorans]ARU03818.1 L-serine ammonia-lyase [Comamonas serinivorans]